MKKIAFILIVIPFSLLGQISVAPFIGLSSTRMSQSIGYENGGNYSIYGVEVEYQHRKNQYSVVNVSIASGVSYLANGFDRNVNFTYTPLNYSDIQSTQIKTTYWQVPVIVRINFRPFPLLEDWQLFLGAGVVSNNLISANMAEQWTRIQKNVNNTNYPGLFPPPTITHAEDNRDVSSYGPKSTLFERFEFGIKFKHVQVTYRLSVSTQDMYYKGIENVWNVPAAHSLYIDAHDTRGVTKIKLSEIVFGWRFK